jgi:hypothetical protein
MKTTPDGTHAHCATHNCYVPLNQTEGHCRDQHSCNDDVCPLEKELGRPRFGRALDTMAAGLGQMVGKIGG